MSPKKGDEGEGAGTGLSMQRSRWATRKLTVKSSSLKRLSLVTRKHRRNLSNEKKRASGGTESLRQSDGAQNQHPSSSNPEAQNDDNNSVASEAAGTARTVYFNLPLPAELKDPDGHPSQEYTRNKIRTAKYTPLSFIPKNLWFQFHNIANIFFLFLVILVVSIPNASDPPSFFLTALGSFVPV
jgi:phospholipid-translocating ATPase